MCTNKVCKEAGLDTCKTRFSCYTELILNGNQEFGKNATKGCTELVYSDFSLSKILPPVTFFNFYFRAFESNLNEEKELAC